MQLCNYMFYINICQLVASLVVHVSILSSLSQSTSLLLFLMSLFWNSVQTIPGIKHGFCLFVCFEESLRSFKLSNKKNKIKY